MWRVLSLIAVTAMFIFSLSGFKTVENEVIEVVGCSLSGNEAYFRVFPKAYEPGMVTLNVKVYEGDRIAALGSRKIELLHMPAEGLSFRVPLTGNLSIHQTYKVIVDLPGNHTHAVSLTWQNLAVSANSSAGFFQRNFNPIGEPSELRNQFKTAKIRTSLR
ncbi:MAG: hypothetical protein ACD_39C01279G0003 [uncultured bacterium]|nr:MAG: hypothetical protein ACD_39C01279G0003 [uncultured bacterium]